jgi:predicted HTH transcriptional regulator
MKSTAGTVETNRVEFKLALTDGLEKEAVAFLNADGGQIYFGIRDDGSIAGVENADALQLQVKDRIVNNIRPGTMGLFDLFVEEKEGKKTVVLSLAGGPSVPYYIRKYGRSEKGCYLRVGSAAQPMTEEHIEKLLSRRQNSSLTSVLSRHQDLTFNQLKIFYEGKGVVLNRQFAKTLELVMPGGEFNQLAYLFADVNRVSVRVAKWWGTGKMRLRENEEYGDCSLVKAMQKVLDKFEIENVTQARKRGLKTREELRLADSAALRELIINAFAHNDYANGDTPIFEIFSNRFEITSYGGLVSGMTREEFFTGVSRPRNPEIMRIFKDLEYVERLGSGVPYVVQKYGRGIFHFMDSIIRFVLPFDRSIEATERPENAQKTPRKHPEDARGTAGEQPSITQKILEAVRKNPFAGRRELAEVLNMTDDRVKWHLSKLKKSGIICHVGPDKGGHWKFLK